MELEGLDAAKTAALIPRLKSKLCGVDGKVDAAVLKRIFGEDGAAAREVLLSASSNVAQRERVLSVDVRSGGATTAVLSVMVREGALSDPIPF